MYYYVLHLNSESNVNFNGKISQTVDFTFVTFSSKIRHKVIKSCFSGDWQRVPETGTIMTLFFVLMLWIIHSVYHSFSFHSIKSLLPQLFIENKVDLWYDRYFKNSELFLTFGRSGLEMTMFPANWSDLSCLSEKGFCTFSHCPIDYSHKVAYFEIYFC